MTGVGRCIKRRGGHAADSEPARKQMNCKINSVANMRFDLRVIVGLLMCAVFVRVEAANGVTCPPADAEAEATVKSFFTTDFWESQRASSQIDPIDPSQLQRITTYPICSWISSNIDDLPADWQKAYYRLPDQRIIVYAYRPGPPSEVDPETGDIWIKSGHSVLTIYSPQMTMIAGYLI